MQARFALACSVLIAPAIALGISAEDYQLYMTWASAQEDPAVTKLSEDARVALVAKNEGISQNVLRAAITAGSSAAPTLKKDSETAIAARLEQTPLKGRVREVHVDAASGHVVAGVKWLCGHAPDHDKESSYAAWAVAEASPVIGTLVVWCVDDKGTKLFSAKIGRSSSMKITQASIDRFASSRYIRLFDDVKRGPH